MKIHNEISVHAPADELFGFLSDVERVGPCLPGASIEGRDGDDYAGRMKVKVGPINATYQGKLRFVELDKEARRAVMRARADEVNGQGNAEASITTEVEEAGEDSVIRMDTDLQMRGKVAQFGRGAMEKISQRMFEEFARNIERQFDGNGTDAQAGGDEEADEAAPAAAGREGGGDDREAGDETGRRGGDDAGRGEQPAKPEPAAASRAASDDGASLDVLGTFGGPMLAKAGPVVAAAVLAFGYGVLLGRLRESRATVQRMARLL
jgi:carbon monoxide dehydrogenase subunit G